MAICGGPPWILTVMRCSRHGLSDPLRTKYTRFPEFTGFRRYDGVALGAGTTRIRAADERFEFVDFIARNPEAGDLVPASGGVRKVRWGRQGSGKRGGVRIIYFCHDPECRFI